MSYTPDGQRVDDDEPPERPWHDPHCRNGWLPTPPIEVDPEQRPRPCPICKQHLAQRNTPDTEPAVSERARRAIELEALRDKHRRR